MKKNVNRVFLIAGFLMMAFSAWADGPITLIARSGEEIKIWYGTPRFYSNGNTSDDYVSGVHVVVTGGVPSKTRVVLVNNCRPSNASTAQPYTISWDCGYEEDGSWVNSENCAIRGPSEYRSGNSITTWWANHGGETNCYQQVAIAKGPNNWLVDRISGEHNFNFRFPQTKR